MIRIEKTDENPELVLEEDHGQADEDDKEHIGVNFFWICYFGKIPKFFNFSEIELLFEKEKSKYSKFLNFKKCNPLKDLYERGR